MGDTKVRMRSVEQFKQIHKERKTGDSLRMGQRFCNMYLKSESEVPDLFFCQDDERAIWMIRGWLDKNHYHNELPQELPA